MKLKSLLLILLGVGLAVVFMGVYRRIKPRPTHFWAEQSSQDKIKLVNLQDEISNQRKNAIVLAAGKVGPAVVSITVIQTRVVTTQPMYSPFADDFFDEFFRDFFPPRQYREQIQSLGSGVIVAPDGYIVTNEHVVSNATEIKVTLPDARQFTAKVVGADRAVDVALLKVEAKDLPYAPLGNSEDLIIGEWVIALGNPFAFLLEDTEPTVTVGVVSALRRAMKSSRGGGREERIYKDMIQTDAAINPGNSGGPLVNIMGEVIGINTFIFSSSGGSEGVGFALPVNIVKRVITELKQHGKKREPWHGIYVQELTPELAKALNIERTTGILVSSVDDKSPAEKNGVKAGDLIIEAQGKTVRRVTDWEGVDAQLIVGDTLKIKLSRGNKEMAKKFIVAEYSAEAIAQKLGALGLVVADINPILRQKYNLTRDKGVVITELKRGSLGGRLGLQAGDVILQWGGQTIANADDFIKTAHRISGEVRMIIDRQGMLLELSWRM